MVSGRKLLLALLQQSLKALDALIPRQELPLGYRNLLLQARVLLDKLSLNMSQLLQVTLQERHLLLLSAVVAAAKDIVVLLAGLIKRDLKFNNLQTN